MAISAIGRAFNVVPIAAGAALSMRDCSGITFVCTGNDTFTITTSATFGGTYATPGNIIVNKLTNTSTTGTAAWVAATQTASNAVTISSGTVAFYIPGTSLADPLAYIKCTQSSAGLVTAILGDLLVQRRAANLAIVSA
jgi:hypothetical protein